MRQKSALRPFFFDPRGAGVIRYLFLAGLCVGAASAQLTVSLSTLPFSGQPVGSSVLLNASANGAILPIYQFVIQQAGGIANIVRDYSPVSVFSWTSINEGSYTLTVNVSDLANGNSGSASIPFQLNSRVTGGTPVVSATNHPLVALYSGPPCIGQIRVYFQAVNSLRSTTPWQPCNGASSVNFYIAGMYANSTYFMVQQVQNAGVSTYGPRLSFQTQGLPSYIPAIYIKSPPTAATSVSQLVTMVSAYNKGNIQATPFATDIYGRPLWFLPVQPLVPYITLVRPTAQATLIVLPAFSTATGNNALSQTIQEVDLIGNILHETTVPRVNAQLTALGQDTINWFSHEGLRMPNGHTLTFGSVEKLLTNVQGPGTVDVVGDMVIDLDPQFQVAWTWNSFDHMDTTRMATLGETCQSNIGCGPLYLATTANDWTHGNSIRYVPSDGSIIISQRNQDFCQKIDYGNGTGTGTVKWRLGPGGDFTVISSDPSPWFTHQHDFGFDGVNYEVYDNGNVRYKNNNYTGTSRGQVWKLDETALTATLVLNADMGVFSPVVGTAQLLSNGNYQFLNGNLSSGGNPAAQAIEVLPDGTKNLSLIYASWAYRVFRMNDLYSYNPN